MELMSILQQESTQDLRSHEDKHEEKDVPFDEGESSNSEQSESKGKNRRQHVVDFNTRKHFSESVRLTRAAKKKATTKRNELEKDKSTPRKSAPKVPPLLLSQQKTKLKKTEPPKVQSTGTRSSGRKPDQNNNNALSIGSVLKSHAYSNSNNSSIQSNSKASNESTKEVTHFLQTKNKNDSRRTIKTSPPSAQPRNKMNLLSVSKIRLSPIQ